VKLYLSSFRLGDHPERLVDLLPASPRVAVIANSIDNEDPELRVAKVAAELTWLAELGLRADELDLRDYSGGSAGSGDSAVSAGSGDELRRPDIGQPEWPSERRFGNCPSRRLG
jgi:dipeptidase E